VFFGDMGLSLLAKAHSITGSTFSVITHLTPQFTMQPKGINYMHENSNKSHTTNQTRVPNVFSRFDFIGSDPFEELIVDRLGPENMPNPFFVFSVLVGP
jgi:hypothetical protein